MRESATDRDITIAFVHSVFVGESGDAKFDPNTRLEQTDAFIERCLDHPDEKALVAMAKVKK
jgi:hypothetical protein